MRAVGMGSRVANGARYCRGCGARLARDNPATHCAACACHLVAYQAFDQGDRVQAVEWYRSSAELAARCGAQGMYVFAICGVAYMYARAGRGELAGSVLEQLAGLSMSAADPLLRGRLPGTCPRPRRPPGRRPPGAGCRRRPCGADPRRAAVTVARHSGQLLGVAPGGDGAGAARRPAGTRRP